MCGPIASYISDIISRAVLIKYGLISIAIFSFVGIYMFSWSPSLELAIIYICGHAMIFSISSSIINVFVVEIFPCKFRYSCSAFFYSIGLGFIGGTSPAIAHFILDKLKLSILYVALYVALVSLLGCAGVIAIHSSSDAV